MRQLTVLAGVLLIQAPALAESYHLVGPPLVERIGSHMRTTQRVRHGTSPLDVFDVVRVRDTDARYRGAILLFPGGAGEFGSNLYETRDGNGDFTTTLTAFLATRGIEVYTYTTGNALLDPASCLQGDSDCILDPDSCAGRTLDCSFADIGFQRRADDADFVRREMFAEDHPGKKLAIGGYSGGALSSIAAVNAAPHAWAGIWIGDVPMVYDGADPAQADAQAVALQACEDMTAVIAAGATVYKSSFFDFGALAPYLSDPAVKAFAVAVLTAPNPAGDGLPIRFAAGDPATSTLYFTSDARIQSFATSARYYGTWAFLRDWNCTKGGATTEFIDNLWKARLPVLAQETDIGCGPFMQATLGLFGSTRVTVLRNQDYGHLDGLLADEHASSVEGPLAEWLLTAVFD